MAEIFVFSSSNKIAGLKHHLASKTSMQITKGLFKQLDSELYVRHGNFMLSVLFCIFIPKLMAVGQIGLRGAVVQPVFVREISVFEHERVRILFRVTMDYTAMGIMPSKWTA